MSGKFNELSELYPFLLPVLISSFASNPGKEKKKKNLPGQLLKTSILCKPSNDLPYGGSMVFIL